MRVCICEMLPVEFGWSCRVEKRCGQCIRQSETHREHSPKLMYMLDVPRTTVGPREHLGAACEDEKGHAGGAHTHEETRDEF